MGVLLVLAVIAAVIYFAVKGRIIRLREEFEAALRRAQGNTKKPIATEEMVKCPTCGTYAVATQQKNCGKPGCPYAADRHGRA